MKKVAGICLVIGLCTATGLLAQQDEKTQNSSETARSLLERMSRAMDALNFQGEFMYMRGDQLDVMQVVHQATDEGVKIRLLAMTGDKREVLRINDRVMYVLAEGESIAWRGAAPGNFFPYVALGDAAHLSKQYTFEIGGIERVANHESQVVDIKPRDTFRYGYRLWLDRTSGMLLRSAVVDAGNRIVEQVMFTRIEIGLPISTAALKPVTSGKWIQLTKPEEIAEDSAENDRATQITDEKAGDTEWKIGSVPPGFALRNHERVMDGDMPLEHIILTDGLASVSLYIAPRSADTGVTETAIGAMHVVSRPFEDYTVTAVGEVPIRTLVEMVRAVQKKTPG